MSTFRHKVQTTMGWVKPVSEAVREAASEPVAATPRPARGRSGGARKAAPAPVTAHRLFPAFAAAWFAALLGLASLAIPGPVLGALVVATGLPALVPAAAPPLGFTAHLLVAFMMAGLGGALGLALGLRLRPRGVRPARPAETVAPAPASEADDVYKVRARDAHPDAPPRRPLVLAEALGEPLGEEPEIADVPLLRRKPQLAPGSTNAVQPLDLAALDLAEADEIGADEVPAFMAPGETATAEPASGVPEAPVLIAATPQLPAGFSAALQEAVDGTWSPVAGAPLDSLGLVQLIERLALAITARKAVAEAALADAGDADFEPAEPEDVPGPFSRPQIASPRDADAPAADVPAIGSPREAILGRLGAIAAGTGDGQTDGPLPFSRPTLAAAPAVTPLRPAEPGTVPAAPSAEAAPFEGDAALRSALATLQRMTARG